MLFSIFNLSMSSYLFFSGFYLNRNGLSHQSAVFAVFPAAADKDAVILSFNNAWHQVFYGSLSKINHC